MEGRPHFERDPQSVPGRDIAAPQPFRQQLSFNRLVTEEFQCFGGYVSHVFPLPGPLQKCVWGAGPVVRTQSYYPVECGTIKLRAKRGPLCTRGGLVKPLVRAMVFE